YASRYLPRQSARRRHAADVALRAHAVAVDRAPVVIGIDQAFAHHLQPCVVPRLRALLRIKIVVGIRAALPLEPQASGFFSVQIVLDLVAHVARELLRALADDQQVVGGVHDELRDLRRRTDALDARHGASALL